MTRNRKMVKTSPLHCDLSSRRSVCRWNIKSVNHILITVRRVSVSAEDQLINCGGFAEIATSAKLCDNPSGCLAGLRCKFSSAGRGFLPKVGSAALSKFCSGLKIPCSGEAFVTGRTAAAFATTQRAGNTSACFVNKLETNCSQLIPLYLLCSWILISVVLHGEDALKIAREKKRPKRSTCVQINEFAPGNARNLR